MIFEVSNVVDIGSFVKNGISIVVLNIVNKCCKFKNVYCVGCGFLFIFSMGFIVCLNILLFCIIFIFFDNKKIFLY